MNKYLLLSLALAALPLMAQLSAPNAAGVANGHEHLRVRDVEAQKRFWVDVLGAAPGKLGNMEMMKLPGTIVLFQAGEVSGGSQGSVVDHLAFKVRDLKAILAKAKAAGVTYRQGGRESAMVEAPDGVMLELIEDRSLSAPVVHHHIHFHTEAVAEMKAWYVKMFGAIPGKRGNIEAADLPGVNLSFEPPKGPVAPTKGRSLDHIGFEVKNLEAFCRKLEAAGVQFDVPYKTVPALGVSLAFLTDPWGTYIELTEGLDRL
jgi:catechol 2,3-dioxygenase-like lactoylglutathione lyase family enzyme